jgi:hypothetical protein
MKVTAIEVKIWKSGIFVSAVSMPTIAWLWQLIGFLMQKLIQKEKRQASGLMPGAISAKIEIVTQLPVVLVLSDNPHCPALQVFPGNTG